ncbi:MAG: hypothetical protein IT347_10780 [Candidatus Eisenbacteria bacterium]|nr:hypothetical protein [Candidatus Eisenbacteria bacterium]
MKSLRLVSSALFLGAIVLALAGCGKSTESVAPTTPLDTTPPAAPSNVAGSYDAASERDYLNWDGSSSADVASYEIWQYETDPSLGGTGVLLGSTDAAAGSYALPLTRQARVAWFRVRAIDEAGNQSAFSNGSSYDLHAWDGNTSGRGTQRGGM